MNILWHVKIIVNPDFGIYGALDFTNKNFAKICFLSGSRSTHIIVSVLFVGPQSPQFTALYTEVCRALYESIYTALQPRHQRSSFIGCCPATRRLNLREF